MDLKKVLSTINGKPSTAKDNTPDDLPIYKGQKAFKVCEGEGCSKMATKISANLYGVNYDELNPQDAWYKRAAVLKGGGKEIWNSTSKNKYSGLKIGDFVSLDRGISGKEFYPSKNKGYDLKNNEGNEHLGVVIGKDENGRILVKHGSENGNVYIQPIDEIEIPEYGFKYKATSIYRSKALEGNSVKNDRDYINKEIYKGVSRQNILGSRVSTKNEDNYIKALNSNAQLQQDVLKLQPTEAKKLRDIAFGIFQNESEAGDTNTPIGLKMLIANSANKLGRKASASLGDVQFKYDDIRKNADGTMTDIGRRMGELNVERSGMYNILNHRKDYNDESNAVMSLLASNYHKIKNNPEKYQYNQNNNTVYGDIPIEQALLSSYNKPSYIDSKAKLLTKEKYAKNALSKMAKLNAGYQSKGTKARIPTVSEILNTPDKSIGSFASKLIDLGIM